MAGACLTDAEIDRLTAVRKVLPADWRSKLLRLTRAKGFAHERASLLVYGADGETFTVNGRVNVLYPEDFSAILSYVPRTGPVFRLRRYNGLHPPGFHPNVIEGTMAKGFHIHQATERYQVAGLREDAFAVSSDRFTTYAGAVDCLMRDCGFVVPPSGGQQQLPLF
jgi:hypothetical protein